MNLSKFLPGFAKKQSDEPTEEELDAADAEARAKRIQHHRDNVRNGPRQERHFSQGRVVSFMRRNEKAELVKQNRRARRDWIRANKDLSRLRGQLEVVAKPDLAGRPIYENAMRGLFDGYGTLVSETLEIEELDFDNQEHRSAVVQAAVHHYAIATGQEAA